MQQPSDDEVQRFYKVGALGLRALQDHGVGPQRFGDDAAARWRAFRGELTDSHRLDLLLRDAAATYPLGFAARAIFALDGLAGDEPFGRDWRSLPPSKAGPILRDAAAVTSSVPTIDQFLTKLADVWGEKVQTPEPGTIETIGPASRVVISGPGAVVAVAKHMSGRRDMDFADQILLVTDRPAIRQLAGIAAALCGSRKPPACVGTQVPANAIEPGFGRATLCIVSPDAEVGAKDTARRIAGELGASV